MGTPDSPVWESAVAPDWTHEDSGSQLNPALEQSPSARITGSVIPKIPRWDRFSNPQDAVSRGAAPFQ
jgi:hypothetical protein